MHHQAKTIERASTILGVIALILTLGVGWLIWWFGGVAKLPLIAHILFLMSTLPFAFHGAVWLLGRANLRSPWLKRLDVLVDQGLPGIRQRLRERRSAPGAPTDTH